MPRSRVVTRGGRGLRRSVAIHAVVYLAVNAVLVAIWALTGGGTFWPVWALLGWGVALAAHWAPVAAGVGTRPAETSSETVAALVARERPSLQAATAPDGTVTILFTDIAGSTVLNQRLGDEAWVALLREHHRIVRDAVREHAGVEVKAQGDGFMLAFASPARALGCATAIQTAMDAELAARSVRVRIGVHTGTAIEEDDDLYGRDVVLAARLTDLAAAGETLVSQSTRDRAADGRFGAPRELELKGLGPAVAYPCA